MTSIKKTAIKKCKRCCEDHEDCHYKIGINMRRMRKMRDLYHKKENEWKDIEEKKSQDQYTKSDIIFSN